jgi:tRNA(Ile)-lysidine synthase
VQQLEAAVAETLRALDPPRPFAVAVSGGPDSTALMRLAAPFAPIVFTVDHGLRPGSDAEARQVRLWARQLGLSHEVLRWTGPKPSTGIQEAARKARYRLLADACGRTGAATLMTGHTLDDQIETVAMRAAKGSGKSGLAGMPSQSLLAGGPLRLVRPLLATRKAILMAWLEDAGQEYLTDPSNTDRRFDRARLRSGEGPAWAIADIVATQRTRARVELEALDFLRSSTVDLPSGGVAVGGLENIDGDVLDTVLAASIRRAGGDDYPGTRAERGRIAAALRGEGVFRARTLAGALVRAALGRDGLAARGRLVFEPERPGKPRRSGYWLPMGQFVQLAADGSFIRPEMAPIETTGV